MNARRPESAAADPHAILVIAGEVSGDQHAALLVRALRAQAPELRFFGIGGACLRAEGVDIIQDIGPMAVMGVVEVLRRYGFFRRVFARVVAEARARRPAAAILVDYPGFNLRLAAVLKSMGIKVVYYICPQVWAWNRRRIPRMARIIDRLITIFPFEPALFAGTGLRATFAGHPLVDEAARAWSEPSPALPWNGEPRIALLPGSREQEVRRLLPALWEAARELERTHPTASFIVAAPRAEFAEQLRAQIATLPEGPRHVAVVGGQTRQVLRQADAAVVASGTATLEASLMLCPMVIVYRVAPLTYAMARRLVRVPHIGLVNIVAGRGVCRELIQDAVTPEAIAGALRPLLDEPAVHAAMEAELATVNAALGDGGAAERAADCVIEELRR